MNIDKAIKHAEKLAEEHTQYNRYGGFESCDEYAKEYRQIANWLKELKTYKAVHEESTLRLIDANAYKKHLASFVVGGENAIVKNGIGNYWIDGIHTAYREIDNAPTIKTFTLADIEEQYAKGMEKGLEERPRGECNQCRYYEGVHGVQGHAPCSFWKIGGVFWNDFCSRYEKEGETE